MHEHPSGSDQAPESEFGNKHEHETGPTPAIYVASLSDYNNGVLHGAWINAARDIADVQADVAAMLSRSRQPDAEEFAIHDNECFGSFRVHEFDSLEHVLRVARGIQEHGLAFAAWAEVHEGSPERLGDFEDAFLGRFESVEDYAEQLVDDLGYSAELAKLPESVQPYVRIDTAAMARDFLASSDIYVAPAADGGVWLFDGTV